MCAMYWIPCLCLSVCSCCDVCICKCAVTLRVKACWRIRSVQVQLQQSLTLFSGVDTGEGVLSNHPHLRVCPDEGKYLCMCLADGAELVCSLMQEPFIYLDWSRAAQWIEQIYSVVRFNSINKCASCFSVFTHGQLVIQCFQCLRLT